MYSCNAWITDWKKYDRGSQSNRELVMVDGVIGFDYSADVRLVSTDSPPEMRTIAGQRTPMRQPHFHLPREIRQQKRYYEVLLRRDLTH
jgi:hypothetical protein